MTGETELELHSKGGIKTIPNLAEAAQRSLTKPPPPQLFSAHLKSADNVPQTSPSDMKEGSGGLPVGSWLQGPLLTRGTNFNFISHRGSKEACTSKSHLDGEIQRGAILAARRGGWKTEMKVGMGFLCHVVAWRSATG